MGCSFRNARCLLFLLSLGLAAVWAGEGCGSGATVSIPTTCSSDADCGSGKGCLTVSGWERYCAPVCQTEKTCPAKMACPLYDLVVSGESPSCVEIGLHGAVGGVCELYERSLGPSSCVSATIGGYGGDDYGFGYGGYRGGYGGYGGYSYGYGGSGGTGGWATTSTSTSCRLSNCTGNGFIYSCASTSSKSSTDWKHDDSGNLVGWTSTVSYSNGNSVICQATGAHGSCTGSGGAQCSW